MAGFCILLYGTIFILTLHILKLSKEMLRKSSNHDIYFECVSENSTQVIIVTCLSKVQILLKRFKTFAINASIYDLLEVISSLVSYLNTK